MYCWKSIEHKNYLKVFYVICISKFYFFAIEGLHCFCKCLSSSYSLLNSAKTQQQTAFWYVQLVRYAQQVTERSPTLFLSIKQNFSISFKTQRLWCGPSVLYGNLWVNVHLDLQQSFIAWEVFLVLTTYNSVFMIEVWKILNELF